MPFTDVFCVVILFETICRANPGMWAIMLFPVSPEFFHVRPFKHLLFHSFQVIRKKNMVVKHVDRKKKCAYTYMIYANML